MFDYIFVTIGYAEDTLGGVVGFRYIISEDGFESKDAARKSLCETILYVYSKETKQSVTNTETNYITFRKWMENILVSSTGQPLAFYDSNQNDERISWEPYWYLPDDMSTAFSYAMDDGAAEIFKEICKLASATKPDKVDP